MRFRLSGVLRRWLERAVVVVAALATIATSRPRWHVRLTELPEPPDPAKPARLIVEASHQTELTIQDASGTRWILPERSSAPDRPQYLVPPGARLDVIEMTGLCHTGMCDGPCKAPADAFVRIASITATETWHAEDTQDATAVLDPGAPSPTFRVSVLATRAPTLQIDVADRAITPMVSGPVGGYFYVRWSAPGGRALPLTVAWTARAVVEGLCPGLDPCAAPPDEHVEIQGITLVADGQ